MTDEPHNVVLSIHIESGAGEHFVVLEVDGQEFDRVGPFDELDVARDAAERVVEVLKAEAEAAGVEQPKSGSKLS